MKKIELLSPAKNLEVGIAAINHGADAVYIGGPSFGAREKVGNSIEDIETLCKHAALFDAKVYVTMNTLLFDNELEDARKLAYDCWNAGVDALIVQDMALLNMDMPPIALHASTQCHNIDAEKVKFLEDVGFSQVVLARELSIEQIKDIRSKTTVPLEYFIHGALCVSYSGQCYLSHVIGGRSANRGACAQPCRLSWNLENAEGKRLVTNRHLLSLRDLNNSKNIEELIDAGISSFKIEGRLKDIDYVKNVTAFYRKTIDEIIERRDDICRSSRGESNPAFYPNPEKSFSRGFTDYFIHGRQKYIDAPYSPKSMGEYLGTIEKVKNKSVTIRTGKTLHNGDGLCFLDRENNLLGFNVNAVAESQSQRQSQSQSQRQTVTSNSDISMATRFKIEGSKIFRNSDLVWQKEVEKSQGNRKMKIDLIFTATEDGFALSAKLHDTDSEYITTYLSTEKEIANNAEKALENIKNKLSQWGDTEFVVEEFYFSQQDNETTRQRDLKTQSHKVAESQSQRQGSEFSVQQPTAYFIRASVLGEMKKDLVEKLRSYLIEKHRNERECRDVKVTTSDVIYPKEHLTYLGNVINKKAREFYELHGVKDIEDGLEKIKSNDELVVMTTKHCIRYANNICSKEIGKPATSLYLVNDKGRFRLDFDCRNCCMKVIKEK